MTSWSRLLAWVWLGAVAVGAGFGMAAAYRDPETLRIDAFAAIYTAAGLNDRLMITAFLVLPLVIAIGAAAFILVGRGRETAASVFAIGLLAIYFYVSGAALGLPGWIGNPMASISLILISGFLVLFPSATFRPRWAVAAPALTLGLVIVRPGLAGAIRTAMATPLEVGDRVLAVVGLGALLVVAAAAQVVRYRWMSSATERYQSRWVLAALVLINAPPITILVLHVGGFAADSALIGYLVLGSALGSFALPAAIAVATFRYHLYEIDRIISRTITYGLVAVVVTGVYVGMVVALPALAGTGGGAYVAGATLAATAVFNPARRRIQKAVDRRFNRTRYDSVRELEALSSRVSAVADVAELEKVVMGVLVRTIQPAGVSCWFSQ